MEDQSRRLVRGGRAAEVLTVERQRASRIEAETGARGLEPLRAGLRGAHMLGIGLPAGQAIGAAPRLAAESVHVEVLGSVMRVSPHLHVTDQDVERLLAALDSALARDQ